MKESFETITSDFHKHFTADSDQRLRRGLVDGLGELVDPSRAASEAQRDAAASLLQRYESLDLDALGFDTRLDVDLAKLMLRADIHERSFLFNGRTQADQMPKAGAGVGNGIFLLFINDPRRVELRLDDIVGRLEGVPEFVEKMIGRLHTPIARWVQMDIETVVGLPTLFETVEAWAAEESYAELPRLKAARIEAESALTWYVEALQALPTSEDLHVGDEVAREIVAFRGLEMNLEELHQMATGFLAETRTTIETLRARLVTKYDLPEDTDTEKLQKYLAQRYRIELPSGEVEDILGHYEATNKEILEFIRERELFPVLENQSMNIIRTPAFMAPTIPAGAMLPPPSFREGIRTSMVYLTLSEELMDEHTALSIPGMMVHEGIPGHHLQYATASNQKSVVRRHVNANDHAEGWTTMLEDYMLDVGYLADLSDEVRFCGKRDLSRIGARVGIDLFFMTGDKKYLDVGVDCDLSSDDPFVAAGNLLAAVTGFVPSRVQAELNWYSQERGYPLSYLTGNTIVWQMKREISEAQKGVLEGLELDRRFHEVYLHSGNMPLAYLRRVLVHEGLLDA